MIFTQKKHFLKPPKCRKKSAISVTIISALMSIGREINFEGQKRWLTRWRVTWARSWGGNPEKEVQAVT